MIQIGDTLIREPCNTLNRVRVISGNIFGLSVLSHLVETSILFCLKVKASCNTIRAALRYTTSRSPQKASNESGLKRKDANLHRFRSFLFDLSVWRFSTKRTDGDIPAFVS